MGFCCQRAKFARFSVKPIKDKAYLKKICEKGDILNGQPAEPHHPRSFGASGGQKSSDTLAIPLTREHHDEIHATGMIRTTYGDYSESDLLALVIYHRLKHVEYGGETL